MKNNGKSLALALLLAWLSAPVTLAAPNQTKESVHTNSSKASAQTSEKSWNRSKENNLKADGANTNKPSAGKNETEDGLINVNKATAEELAAALSGIGLKKAQAIVRYREEFGFFSQIEQLQEVSGIGPIFIERNRQKIKM